METLTRFGSSTSSLTSAAAVLRARALAAGLSLAPVEPVDAAAAVVGADAWSLLVRSPSLAHPARHGDTAVRVLAAVLSRCSGSTPTRYVTDLAECSQDPAFLRAAEGHLALAQSLFPEDPVEVVSRAASDLSAAGPRTVFSGYAALLLHVV